MSADHQDPHEIIIVRHRGSHEDEGHHGGVWKIAYADFMTAMMAFFLVMWLVNASNQETKSAVASYFNPVRLVDRKTGAKGVQDLKSPAGTSRNKGKVTTDINPGDKGAQARELPQTEERQLFDHPYAVLAEIAGDVGTKQNLSDAGKGGAATAGPASGAARGSAYRDPFDPSFWSSDVRLPSEPDQSPSAQRKALVTTGKQSEGQGAGKPGSAFAARNTAEEGAAPTPQPKPAESRGGQEPKTTTANSPAGQIAGVSKADTELAALARDIARLDSQDHAGGPPAPSIVATKVPGGLLISVTDTLDYGMFPIGSAKPDKRVVDALAEIAGLLSKRKGEVIISGHTDARPFISGNYDNWRLSTARAQMAYYMLVRGGLDATRVLRVEGYADRQPRNSTDPNAAENRRIDIFLKTPG